MLALPERVPAVYCVASAHVVMWDDYHCLLCPRPVCLCSSFWGCSNIKPCPLLASICINRPLGPKTTGPQPTHALTRAWYNEMSKYQFGRGDLVVWVGNEVTDPSDDTRYMEVRVPGEVGKGQQKQFVPLQYLRALDNNWMPSPPAVLPFTPPVGAGKKVAEAPRDKP